MPPQQAAGKIFAYCFARGSMLRLEHTPKQSFGAFSRCDKLYSYYESYSLNVNLLDIGTPVNTKKSVANKIPAQQAAGYFSLRKNEQLKRDGS
jgi:hypothetical protein